MPYKTGVWGEQAQARNKRRLEYFREYRRNKKDGKFSLKKTIGRIGEQICAKWLTSGKPENRATMDYRWVGMRVEIKTASNINDIWTFYVSKYQKRAQWFFLVCLSRPYGKNYSIRRQVRLYFVPKDAIPGRCFKVGKKNHLELEKYRVV